MFVLVYVMVSVWCGCILLLLKLLIMLVVICCVVWELLFQFMFSSILVMLSFLLCMQCVFGLVLGVQQMLVMVVGGGVGCMVKVFVLLQWQMLKKLFVLMCRFCCVLIMFYMVVLLMWSMMWVLLFFVIVLNLMWCVEFGLMMVLGMLLSMVWFGVQFWNLIMFFLIIVRYLVLEFCQVGRLVWLECVWKLYQLLLKVLNFVLNCSSVFLKCLVLQLCMFFLLIMMLVLFMVMWLD